MAAVAVRAIWREARSGAKRAPPARHLDPLPERPSLTASRASTSVTPPLGPDPARGRAERALPLWTEPSAQPGARAAPEAGLPPVTESTALSDRHARQIRYLRISVTDRCNFRCTYCMPEEGFSQARRAQLLTFDEIVTVVSLMARLGVQKVRLTGGEPLLRRGLVDLVRRIAAVDGVTQVAMTTNGHLLADHAAALFDAGLRRLNVSVDTFDPTAFAEVTRGGDLATVLRGLAAAAEVGFTDLRINAVLLRGVNDQALVPFVERCWAQGWRPRFIELMPIGRLGSQHGDARLPAEVARRAIAAAHPLVALPREGLAAGPAADWVVSAGPWAGQAVGFISPMSDHSFCAACNRARLTPQGGLRACLADDHEVSLRDPLRAGASIEALEQQVRAAVAGKLAAHRLNQVGGGPATVMTGLGG